MNKIKNSHIPFILITCLFFLWGFAHNLDPILIPHLKKSFTLTTTQSTLVDSSVFVAYFIMAMPAGFIMKNGDIKWVSLLAYYCLRWAPSYLYPQLIINLIIIFNSLIYYCMWFNHIRNCS